MDVLSKIMEGIRALREKLASLKYEHRAAVVAIAQAEKSVKDFESGVEKAKADVEKDKANVEKEQSPIDKSAVEASLRDHEHGLKSLEEELASRKEELDGLKTAEAERQAARLNGREELAVEREKARRAANRAISAATTYEELSDIESVLRELSLPQRRVRVKRRWL